MELTADLPTMDLPKTGTDIETKQSEIIWRLNKMEETEQKKITYDKAVTLDTEYSQQNIYKDSGLSKPSSKKNGSGRKEYIEKVGEVYSCKVC